MKCLPERMVVHLNEQKVDSLSAAAIMADEYVLTHKVVFPPPDKPRSASAITADICTSRAPPVRKEERECFYCHKTGHVIANCLSLQRKEQPTSPVTRQPKGIGLIKSELIGKPTNLCDNNNDPDPCFKPFILEGLVSLTGEPDDQRSIQILRDAGGSHSVILLNTLPFSEQSACGYSSVLGGIEMGSILRPAPGAHTV